MKFLKLLLLMLLAAHLQAWAGESSCSDSESGKPKCPVGNPIDVVSGNKFQREVDLPALPGVMGLEIVRYYNSNLSGIGSRTGILGRGWRLSYEMTVAAIGDTLQIIEADGHRLIFARDPLHPSLCSSADPANGEVDVRRTPNGDEYVWRKNDGQRLSFNTRGRLVQILAPTGEFVSMQHDARGWLMKVTDPQGRSLKLNYLANRDAARGDRFRGIQNIDTPVGRFTYGYGSEMPKGGDPAERRELLANLARVGMPDGSARQYHYEDARFPTLLTGVSIQGAVRDGKPVMQRFSTFGYDGNAKAVLSTHANNVDRVTLDTSIGGQTVLTNSLGQKTLYRYTMIAGERRVVEVRGAGCALCGETNVRYGYDALGRATTVTHLDQAGVPVRAETTKYDYYGRPSELDSIDYQGGKPGRTRLVMRVKYAAGAALRPTVIARPSVVPDKELVTRIDYNGDGQPLSVSQTGWSPTFDGKQAAARIERTIRYRYFAINGRSLLAEIDGPLPNGKTNSPADSDVTVFKYGNTSESRGAGGTLTQFDQTDGLLTRVIAPGNMVTEVLERDAALRPAKLRINDGVMAQQLSVGRNWRGDPVDLELAAGVLRRRLQYEYNPLGQIAAVTLPGNLRTTFVYDVAGRPSLTVLPDGSGTREELDTEDRVVRSTRLLDALANGGTVTDLRFAYDRPANQPGRLAEVSDAVGLIERYSYDGLGQLAAVGSALGITTIFDHDAAGQLKSRTDAAGSDNAARISLGYDHDGHATEITAANGVKTLRRYDDFGRMVVEADPDRGVRVFRHDAAGRVVARVDETMVVTRLTYDHAGRLLAMGADNTPNLVQYRYQGRYLVSMIGTTDGRPEHATERVDYERDSFGRVSKETRWLANVAPRNGSPAGFTFVTTSDYDEAGRLTLQMLPDGHRLQYRYVPINGGTANSSYHPGQLTEILFDGSIVITDIEQTIAGGLTGYTTGNGLREQISLDRRGRVERLQVLAATPTGSWWARLKSWLTSDNGRRLLYRQVNHYDADGRVTQIDSQMPSREAGPGTTQRFAYSYDQMSRLLRIRAGGTETDFAYDKGGNRIRLTQVIAGADPASPSVAAPGVVTRYAYVSGTNRLVAVSSGEAGAAPKDGPEAAQMLRSALFYHETGVPLAQLLWSDRGDRASRRIIYNSGKRPVAVYANEQLLARYYYSVRGERVAKTVYPAQRGLRAAAYVDGAAAGSSTYYLYRDSRLAAETDGAGHIAAHYIYFNGKPVAKIEMEEDRLSLLNWIRSRFNRSAPDATAARIYAILTDHVGTPHTVLDPAQTIVWQAETAPFGKAQVLYAAASRGKLFEMNLRLSGQMYDAETGLNQNYYRDYDPELGRYLTADPAGLTGGFNPYAYVNNNPVSKIDPLGLYETDIHYYMTYTLAVLAGMSKDDALRIALATQYVDNNPFTTPIRLDTSQMERLTAYHFTQSGFDRPRNSNENSYTYALNRVDDPHNPQLDRLLIAANQPKILPCSKLQLFGEYLHAYEDTFGHRDSMNDPIDVNLGFGHLMYGHESDKTYKDSVFFSPYPQAIGTWDMRESHTLKMEEAVFLQIQKEFNVVAKDKNKNVISFGMIKAELAAFNAIHEDELGSPSFSLKRAALARLLRKFGLDGVPGYDVYLACKNRQQTIPDAGLAQSDFPGTILATPADCETSN